MDEITAWLVGRLPDSWFVGPPEVTTDREEIVVVGTLAAPEGDGGAATGAGRISRHREDTREQRMRIAEEGQARFGRAFAWGAACGGTRQVFTSLSVPVMTRLRQPERQVLDTLVAAGVARSRSDALGWSVRLVGQHQDDWISALRQALVAVDKVRSEGPTA
ncbi:MAG: hypothetical protein H0T85_10380 [Geodermatophilaceae bacterium]|nr:hypothetical protein [Geodermatophilaceae bacterium]